MRGEVAVNEHSVLTDKTDAGRDPNGHADSLHLFHLPGKNSSHFIAGDIPTNVR